MPRPAFPRPLRAPLTTVPFALDAEEALPPPAEHAAYLDRILRSLEAAAAVDVQSVLDGALGVPADAATLEVTGLHHVAAYVGDWEHEDQVAQWVDAVRAHPRVSRVRWGPSAIAPREYGTPGHWINLTAAGREYELFTCKRSGRWATFPAARKATLMSHYAVAVTGPRRVRPLLDYLTSRDGLDLLAYAPADEVGHTYGHVINRATGQVLEIVSGGEEG